MNTQIDPKVLRSFGILLSPEKEAALVAHLQQILEERVGATILEMLEPTKAQELEHLSSTQSREEIAKWVVLNVPNYEEVMRIEYNILMGEVAEDADNFIK